MAIASRGGGGGYSQWGRGRWLYPVGEGAVAIASGGGGGGYSQ